MTFLKLFAPAPGGFERIEIPLLQRDYAQGRDSTAPRVEQIRNAFLKSLHEALAQGPTLRLDFVYGEVRVDPKNTSITIFEPIDGQQRLTTLFLLHWYLAASGGQGEDFKHRLQGSGGKLRFSYAMRPGTEHFFSRLIEHHAIVAASEAPTQCLADKIKDQAWFLNDWLHDPSVAGALVVLDALSANVPFGKDRKIHASFYDKLSSDDDPITFELIPLFSIGQGDDIYIKMNARGKPLTDFEKFKAWLIRQCGDALTRENQLKLDNDWLEFFWRHSPQKSELKSDEPYDRADHVSRVFFRTFLALAVNHHARNNSKQVESWVKEGRPSRLEESRADWDRLFDKASISAVLDHVSSILDKLQTLLLENHTLAIPDLKFFNDHAPTAFLSHPTNQTLTLGAGLWLHALGLFAKTFNAPDSPEAREWLRIVRNLLEHTTANATNYAQIICGIDALAGNMGDKPKRLADLSHAENYEKPVLGFEAGQLKEEIRKARLRNDDSSGATWKKLLNDAEDHGLLRGQIEFLLGDENPIIGEFEKRWIVFADWFPQLIEAKLGNNSEIDLIRAILGQSDAIKLGWQDWLGLPDNTNAWRTRLKRNTHRATCAFRIGCFRLIEAASHGHYATFDTPSAALGAEPWMVDIIRHGRQLWWHSESGKIQTYYGDGTFLFHQSNKNDRNILLGPVAALRNILIQKLTSVAPDQQAPWQFLDNDTDSRRILCEDGTVFFKGHDITLRRKSAAPASVAECVFGCRELIVRLPNAESAPTVTVGYMPDPSLDNLAKSLHAKGAKLPKSHPLCDVLNQLASYAETSAPNASCMPFPAEKAPATA